MENSSTKIEFISIEQYYTLLNMLNSPDEENVTLAFGVIDRFDYAKNVIVLIMLLKFSNRPELDWKVLTNGFYQYILDKRLSAKHFSYTSTKSLYDQTGSKNPEHEKLLVKSAVSGLAKLVDSFKFGQLLNITVEYEDKSILLTKEEIDG